MATYPYNPYFNPGTNTFAKTVYFSPGSGNSAFVVQSGATVTMTGVTLTGGTLTSPTINTPTITGGTITGATISGAISSSTNKAIPTQVDVTSSTTLVSAGVGVPVVAGGTYIVEAYLPCTAGASGGIKVALVGTASMTATSASYVVANYNTTTVNGNAVTTTFGTALGVTAVSTYCWLTGTVVVNAGGTLDLQFAQNASNGTTTSVLVNGYLRATRIA